MKRNPRLHFFLIGIALFVAITAFAPARNQFTAAEQQQISIATPGLFDKSDAFTVEFGTVGAGDYSFPLPVGKAEQKTNFFLSIETKEGDAVKAMFDGVVRLSRHHSDYGNVVVVRHDNGLETVYANNAQNLVKVGQSVKAGQTIAIVGGKGGRAYCDFAIMVNGARINPSTVIDIKSHRLRKQTLLCKKNGSRVAVSMVGGKEASAERKCETPTSLDPSDELTYEQSKEFKIDLEKIAREHWAYPLPGSHVISPYGGKRKHSGVDIKTCPNDKVLAAFDGVVTLSCAHYGYGNCITIKHAYGFETLYSHQSRNFVKVGQKVKAGQVIGLTGRTGRATTEHLHFEVHFKGRRIDPAVIFNHSSKKLQASTLVLKNGRMTTQKS